MEHIGTDDICVVLDRRKAGIASHAPMLETPCSQVLKGEKKASVEIRSARRMQVFFYAHHDLAKLEVMFHIL